MTKVDFYILSDKHTGLEFTSRLTEKIYRQGHQLHIHTADASMAEHLDMLLVSDDPEDMLGRMESFSAPEVGKWLDFD